MRLRVVYPPFADDLFYADNVAANLCRGEIFSDYVTKCVNLPHLHCAVIAMMPFGMTGVCFLSTPPDTDYAFIDLICSGINSPKGTGKRILEAAEREAKKIGFEKVHLHAVSKELAMSFYTNNGYRLCESKDIQCRVGGPKHCASLAKQATYDEYGQWEGFSMSKIFCDQRKSRSRSSPGNRSRSPNRKSPKKQRKQKRSKSPKPPTPTSSTGLRRSARLQKLR